MDRVFGVGFRLQGLGLAWFVGEGLQLESIPRPAVGTTGITALGIPCLVVTVGGIDLRNFASLFNPKGPGTHIIGFEGPIAIM